MNAFNAVVGQLGKALSSLINLDFDQFTEDIKGIGQAVEESADFSALGGCGVDNGGFSDNRLIVRPTADTSFCYTFDACDDCGTVGIDNMDEERFGVSVYPNPFSDATVIEFAQDGDYNLIITDLTGKVVRTARVQGGSRYDLNASDLKDGLYILQATDANMNVSTTKLIVQ